MILSPAARADTFFVDGANPASNDAGPGTESAPYRTISGAMAAHYEPGVTIRVKPAVYPEFISVSRSGSSANPFIIQAAPGGIVEVLGAGVSGRSWIVIDGFTMHGQFGLGGCVAVTVSNNRIINVSPTAGGKGIYATACSGLRFVSNTISGWGYDGIVFRDVSGCVFEDNEVSRNVNNGLVLNPLNSGSNRNVIRRNRFFDNGASAICAAFDFDNLAIQNVMSGNKHGFQHHQSSRFRHIGDVVCGNTDDGIWINSGSTAISFENCIIAENGTGHSSAYNVYVDSLSAIPESDDNVFWYSNSQPSFRVGRNVYSSLAAWVAATGHDTRSFAADPRFVDAQYRDFHLTVRSPAIDCANTSIVDYPSTDADGRAPIDDPGIPNTGLGAITFADRGAFEFVRGTLAVGNFPSAVAAGMQLMPMFPNPMHGLGRVEFVVQSVGRVRLTIVDIQGRIVATLEERSHAPEHFTATWDGRADNRAAEPGVYFLRLETSMGTATKRFALVR